MLTQEEQQNLAVITEYFDEYWNKANPEIVDKLCVDDFVINYPMHGPRYGKEAAKEMMQGLKEMSHISFRFYQHPLIASGPYVVGRWIGGGTHAGVAIGDLVVGSLDHANTDKKIYFSGITIFTLKDGKIIDETAEEGTLTALQQLGLVTQPNPGKEMKYLHE
ncbi:hypothetical protein LCI18_003970 [Fusarium solani-melongenae]|uniref:Uncharacterized protein n=1 Tax=Fusarium solani subsp. cucurbitae TaxID=2747967 RepID=A0ACD3YVU1_FUSSC|nr:hypothetical protein LCI18_003970 [Fusarium solani-melongenae]